MKNNYLLYQAPLEGITGYIYRNAIAEIFGNIDKYFAPFISPYEKRIITDKEKRQLIPAHNSSQNLVPQILTMDSKGFLELTHWLNSEYGYDEFNLNFGCPSGTVVSKGRGAGALKDLELLKQFLDEITNNFSYKLSIKTRIGFDSVDDFSNILNIYNEYELSELIIHPRARFELYNGLPHMDIYKWACENSKNPLIYNGNITSPEDLNRIPYLNSDEAVLSANPSTKAVMIGRAMIANPAIFREIRGGRGASSEELLKFLSKVQIDYSNIFDGEVNVLHKLKEIWVYMGPYLLNRSCADNSKIYKKLMKAKRLSEYNIYMKEILNSLS